MLLQREKTDPTHLAQLASNFTVLAPQASEYTLAFTQLPSDVSTLWTFCAICVTGRDLSRSVFMPPPFEEWWRGIKCYPCPCVRSSVRPSVIKIWCPLNKFLKTIDSIQIWYVNIYNVISKHRSSSIWVTIHSFLTE